MMKRVVVLALLLVSVVSARLSAQPKAVIRDNFYDAESWVLFEDYKEALPLYLNLLKTNPDNANYKYRIGQCYLNIPGQKEKSIAYLEDAIKNIDPKYHQDKFKETGAPYDALYYLANAYRITNQLDRAISTYEQFKKNLDPEIYDSTVVNMQIQSCRNAMELMKVPLYLKKTNMGDNINGTGSEFDPVVSDKEDMIVFARSEPFYDAILYSTKVNGTWTAPLNLNEILKVDRDLFPSSLSEDGHTLYLYSSADYDGTIYTSEFKDGSWQPMKKLNDNINTKYWESHATISHDNRMLYFTSNRKGTLGGLDIWMSKRDSMGDWGPAVNLGPVINTPYNEESPFLTKDDKTLFFSSRGHYNMGGYDIFYSTRLDNGEWSKPLNVGYPLNTTDDDVFFKPQNIGYEGYYSMQGSRGPGKDDIFRIEIFSDAHPRKFLIRGITTIADLLTNFKDSVKISVINATDKKQIVGVYSDPETGEYEFELPQGKYEITYAGTGGKKVVKTIDLPLLNPSDSLSLTVMVLPKEDNVAVMDILSDRNITVTKGDTVVIPVKAEPESILRVEHRAGGSLVSADQFILHDSLFSYRFVPVMGDNIITFQLTDRFNNTTSTEVTVSRKKAVAEQRVVRPEHRSVIVKKEIDTLNTLANDILSGRDPAIAVIRQKILAVAKNLPERDVVRNAVDTADSKNIMTREKWIGEFTREAIKEGLTQAQISGILAAISAEPGTSVSQFLSDLINNSDEPLASILRSIDPEKENIKTPGELILYLLRNKDKLNLSESELYRLLGELAASRFIPDSVLETADINVREGREWYKTTGIILAGVIVLIIIFILARRKNKDK